MKKLIPFLAVAATAAVTYLCTPSAHAQVVKPDGLHIGSNRQPVKVDGVLEINQPNNNGTIGGCDGGAGICFVGKGKLAWDFLALTGQPATIHTKCSISDAGAAPGCLLGDTVLLGSTVAPPVTHGTLEARITSNWAFNVIACATGINDGGTFDMGDTVFNVRCIR